MAKVKGDYGTHTQAGYADPGLQKDGKPRYPMKEGGKWSEERIRAGWDYIHQKDKQAQYESMEDVHHVMHNVENAWKIAIDPKGPPSMMQAHKTEDDGERVVLAAAEVGAAPEFIQLIPPGRIEPKGGHPFVNDAESRRMVLAAWAKRKNPAVIDYEHQTLKDVQAPAAGWIEDVEDRGDGEQGGIWGKVSWTPHAVEYLKNREYRFLSPVIFRRKSDDRVIRIEHAALTNDPAIDGMVPVINKNGAGAPNTEEVEMNWLKNLLGLPVTATEDEVQAACKARFGLLDAASSALALKADSKPEDVSAAVEALKKVPGKITAALGLEADANENRCEGKILALKNGSGMVSREEFEALKSKLDGKNAEEMVAQAMKDGKVTPANKDWAFNYAKENPEGFTEYCKNAVAFVAEGEQASRQVTGRDGLTDTEIAVCKQFGGDPKKLGEFKTSMKGGN